MATQPAWMADAVPVKRPSWMQDAVPVGEPEAPQDTDSIAGRIGDWIVDNAIGGASEEMRENARTGDFARDAANDEGFFDRAGSLLERGGASLDRGLYNFLGGLGSKRAREEAANLERGTVGQDISGTTDWENANGLGGLAKFIADAGIESIPAMAAIATPYVGPALIAGSQTGNIAADRAANNDSGDITPDDLLTAAPAAVLSTALDRIGIRGITNPVGNTVAGRVGGAATREGLTETAQSGIEYGGGSIGTEAGFDPAVMADQMLQGGVAGFGIGGTARGGAEVVSPVTSRLGVKTRTQRNEPGQQQETDWEGSLDDWMADAEPVLALPKPDWMSDAQPVEAAPAPAAPRAEPAPQPSGPVDDGGTVIRSIFGDEARITQTRRDPNSALGRANPRSWHNRTNAAVDMKPIPGMTFEQAKAAIEAKGFSLIEAKNEVGRGRSRHATGDHWHFVIGQGGGASVDGDIPAVDIPGADDSLLNRGDRQERIARIEIPEATPGQREAGQATPIEIPDAAPSFPAKSSTNEEALAKIDALRNAGFWKPNGLNNGYEDQLRAGGPLHSLAAMAVDSYFAKNLPDRIGAKQSNPQREEAAPTAPEPVPPLPALPEARSVGAQSQVTAPRIGAVDTQFEIRDLSDLIDSAAPNYDRTLQPRDRAGRATSGAQIASIAANLDPAQLGESRLASTGAPIIGPDGQVESGNGRVTALAQAYATQPERAAAYRQMIEGMGLDATGIERPVLVRRRLTEMTPQQRQAWTRAANERDTMAMSSTEQASADAAALDDSVIGLYRGGSVTAAANRDFVRAFIGKAVAPAEQNAMTAADGSISADGVRRVRFALLARAYGDTELIARISEDTDTNIAAIGKALLEAAPSFARLKAKIAAGEVPAQYDISADIAQAARMVSRSRETGQALKGMLAQTDAFSDGPTPETEQVLQLFFRDADLTKPRSGQKVADALIDYTDRAEAVGDGERQGTDMFGNAPDIPSPAMLLQQVRGALEGDGATQGDLLANPPESAITTPDEQGDRPSGRAAPVRPDEGEQDGGPDRAVPKLARGQLRALGIAQELRTRKAAALVGRTASTPKELAELAQVYRDPRYETFRIFYTKGDEIVHATGVSSRSIAEAPLMPADWDTAKFYESVRQTMASSGADGYYLLHNHPSGDPDPSPADKTVTRQIAARVPGFRAHVVINSNKYARIVVDAAGRSRTNIAALDMGEDKLLKPAVPHNALGSKVATTANLAVLAKHFQKPGYVTVVGTAARQQVRVILEYPAETVRRDAKALMGMARRIQRQSGSASLFLIGDRKSLTSPTVTRALAAGIVTAAIDENGVPITTKVARKNRMPQPPGRFVAQAVYHGSPHDWEGDRADISRVGTGEGAAAYGWGLYFAGKRQIAEHYRRALTRGQPNKVLWKGQSWTEIKDQFNTLTWTGDMWDALMALDRVEVEGSVDAAIEFQEKLLKRFPTDTNRSTLAWMKAHRDEIAVEKKGRLYTVDIPEDGEYLLWDKGLSEQPEKVKAALAAMPKNVTNAIDDMLDEQGMNPMEFDDDAYTGRHLYRMLVNVAYEGVLDGMIDTDGGDGKRDASLALKSLGVRGIKYFDGTSRRAARPQKTVAIGAGGVTRTTRPGSEEDATFNYVLFDDSTIKTLAVEEKGEPFSTSDDSGGDLASKLVDKDGITRDIAAIKKAVGNPIKTLGALADGSMAEMGRAFFYTMDARMRTLAKRFDSPAIDRLANMFHAEAGKTDSAVDETYHEAVQREGFGRASRAWRTLEPYFNNKAAMDRIGLMLRNPGQRTAARKGEVEAAAKIARLLKDTIDYRKKAGEDIGEVTDGYFPRWMDVEKVMANRDLFLRQATELYRKHEAENPAVSAKAWMARIFDQYAGLDGGVAYAGLFRDARPAGVGRKTAKERAFGKDADKLLGTFYSNDAGEVLTAYFIGAARKAEEARRFGDDKLERLMNQIKREMRKSGEDPGDALESLAKMIDTNLGRVDAIGERMRSATSILHTAGQLGTLDRATVTSLSEAMMGFVRGGPRYGIPMLKNSVQEFVRQVRGRDPSEVARLAEALGIIEDVMVGDTLAARAGFERSQTTSRAAKVQRGFFKATGLHQWTEGTRAAATAMGQAFLRNNAADMGGRSAKRAAENLRELGIKDPQAFAKWLGEGGEPTVESLTAANAGPMQEQYRAALMRFVNQTIMKPNRAEKPRWASTPYGALVFSLMSFSYGFKKNVLDRTGRLAVKGFKEGDPSLLYPAFGLAGLLAAHTVINSVLRQAVFGGARDDEEEGIGWLDVAEAIDRAGLTGAASRPLNALWSLRYRQGIVEAMMGPVIGRPADLVEKVFTIGTDANSPNTNTAERAAAGALYDVVLEPALEAYGVTRFKGPLAAGVVWGSGNREGGVVPPDRDWFVEAVAGSKMD